MIRLIKDYGMFVILVIAIVILHHVFWFAVTVDGHSMDPTLSGNERLIVVKHTTISRGDIVVAQEVDEVTGETKSIVKRVVGMPGDTLSYHNDVLTINNKKVDEPYLKDYLNQFASDKLQQAYREDVSWQLQASDAPAFTLLDGKADFSVQVPDGYYYLLGDNRIISKDSRAVGSFNASDILGEVKFRYWPLEKIGLLH